MDKQGLILGLDIEDKRTQIAYFHEQSGKVSPINDDDGKAVFDNQVSLNKILSEKSSDGLAELIERMLNEAKVRTESEYIEKVCFVIHRYTEENRQLFREALEKAGIPMVEAQVAMVPQTYVELTDEQDVKNLQRTLDLLDEDDDVTDVWTNWDE